MTTRKVKKLRDIQPERTPMPVQDPVERAENFDEVATGYSEDDALREAERCLLCPKAKCVDACPVSIDIPGFIDRILEHDYHGAWEVIGAANLMPAVCGRVCPQEDQCEGVCVVGKKLAPVAVGRLERWVGDLAIAGGWTTEAGIEPNGKRIGIVGSGPAGIACAADMAKAGCEVTVFEALHKPGGVLRYGIPEFRLPDCVIDAEIENLKRLGVRVECNTLVGRLFTIEQMIGEMGFDAVFIGTGAGTPRFMNIPGEYLNGVLSANELLTRCNLMKAGDFPRHDTPLGLGKRVAVIGAGNTAMDALRVSLRLGAEHVMCVYRRTFDESPARLEEIEHAQEEGIEFHWLSAPIELLDDGEGNVHGMRCIRFELGEPDDSGRRRPVAVEDSEFELAVDTVVYAIGTDANPIIGQTSEIGLTEWGFIATDDALATSIPGVYAGGDIVTGGATVILAMGAGRRAARSMKEYLGLAA
jgi:glutamate synthase (NADPH/NADH) small chain